MENIAKTITLRVKTLNDDTIDVAENGYHFQNGHATGKFLVTYWTYANAWCNDKHQFVAKTFENALKHYEKICGKLDEEERDSAITAMYAE